MTHISVEIFPCLGIGGIHLGATSQEFLPLFQNQSDFLISKAGSDGWSIEDLNNGIYFIARMSGGRVSSILVNELYPANGRVLLRDFQVFTSGIPDLFDFIHRKFPLHRSGLMGNQLIIHIPDIDLSFIFSPELEFDPTPYLPGNLSDPEVIGNLFQKGYLDLPYEVVQKHSVRLNGIEIGQCSVAQDSGLNA
jgi:hypothetical protein